MAAADAPALVPDDAGDTVRVVAASWVTAAGLHPIVRMLASGEHYGALLVEALKKQGRWQEGEGVAKP